MLSRRRSFLILLGCVLLILAITFFSPSERTLGGNARLVYLHGALVWTALIGFATAGILGVLGVLGQSKPLQLWSLASGQAATILWILYLPLSLLTMLLNWNGLFLDEPRWRLGFNFAFVACLIQLGILLLKDERLASLLNAFFILALGWSLAQTEQVLHPPSPIFNSDVLLIQIFFLVLLAVCLLAGFTLSTLLRAFQTERG